MKYLISLSILIVMFSCNMETEVLDDSDIIIENKEELTYENHNKAVKKIFYNVPSPLEVSSMLKKAGVEYNAGFLNSFEKVSSYTTTEEMALNLGVYGADLSYNRLYDQIQESVNYFSAIKKLSDDIGIPQNQGGEAAERLESNLENRDSLLNIISHTYSEADSYLKQNDKGSIASLIVYGGWVEALYIATQIASSTEQNEQLMNSIAEQKLSLENLIGLMNDYRSDEIVAKHIAEIEDLKIVYDKVEIVQTANEVTTDTIKHLTTINSETTITMSDETFIEIMTLISKLRNGIIK